MNFAERAMPWLEKGYRVTPLLPKSKIACKPNFPDLDVTRKMVEEWNAENPDYNVGIVAGHGLCILDDDDGTLAEKILADTGIDIRQITYVVRTSKGYHYYWKSTVDSIALGNAKKAGSYDFQAFRKYVVGPHSIHPSGAVYTPVDEHKRIAEIPEEVVKWIAANMDNKRTVSVAGKKDNGFRKVDPSFEFADLLDHYDDKLEITIEEAPWYHIVCPWKEDHHTDGKGKIDERACSIYFDGDSLGFKDQATTCEGSNATIGDLIAKLNEDHEPYPGVIWPLDAPDGLVEEEVPPTSYGDASGVAPQQGKAEADSAPAPSTASERKRVAGNIEDIRSIPGKDMPAWKKSQNIAKLIHISLKQTGVLYNVGNVATYVDNETREITEVVKDGARFGELMVEYGIFPGDKSISAEGLGKYLNVKAVRAPKATIYAGSYYDAANHVLYVNEWAGNILRIDADGNVTRIRNGDYGLLWGDGEAVQATPLHADLDNLPTMTALSLEDESLIKKHILDVINYDESLGMSKQHAQLILMTALVGLFFIERIPAYPYIYFFGPGGSMKTSLAVKVGKLIQGPSFRPTPATTDEDQLKIMAINNPFLLLDEANNLRKLQNAMKAIATGAQDVRRELYTTTKQRISNYQARTWMTANTADQSTETVASRMMIIDVGARTEENPYRSDFYVDRAFLVDRDAIWTELIARLSSAMQAMKFVDEKGRGDIPVSHRMSAFFVFGSGLAKHEGIDAANDFKDAMDAMARRQTSATSESSEIVGLIRALPASYNGKVFTASELAGILPGMVPEANQELKRKASRLGWVSYQLQNNELTLKKELGMVKGHKITKTKNRNITYTFTGCAGGVLPPIEEVMPEATPVPTATAPADDIMAQPQATAKPDFKQSLAYKQAMAAHNKRCRCKGCGHCDDKGNDLVQCGRMTKTDKGKCSACRNDIPESMLDDED